MLHTASEVLTLAKKLENESAKFYEDLSQRYIKDVDTLLSFAKENDKNVVQIERAYYGVITDAIEGCFAFNINPDDYVFRAGLAEGTNYPDALGKAIELEEKVGEFYTVAAEQSESLMADVTRAFEMVAKKRNKRKATLKSFVTGGKEN